MFPQNTEMKSRLSRGQAIAVLIYLPLHLVLLPLGLGLLMMEGMSAQTVNLLYYAIGSLYMLIFCWSYLRRDFDPIWDRPIYTLLEICRTYCVMYLANMAISLLLMLIPGAEEAANPNNQAVMDMAGMDRGKVIAMAVFLAPLVEEPLFRGGLFGLLRRRSRLAAYIVSVLAFSLYHIWSYVILDPWQLIYIVQYLPVSILLCRLYERTDSIWSCIFFHMLNNWLSITALEALEAML